MIINPRITAIKWLFSRCLVGGGLGFSALVAGGNAARATSLDTVSALTQQTLMLGGTAIPLPLVGLGAGVLLLVLGLLLRGGKTEARQHSAELTGDWDIAPIAMPDKAPKQRSKSASDDDIELASTNDFALAPRHFDRISGQLKILIDKIPVPAWIRDPKLDLTFVNNAFAEAVNQTTSDVLHRQTELAAASIGDNGRALARLAQMRDATLTESHTIIVGGKPRLFEITESGIIDGSGVVGFARDYSVVEEMRGEMENLLASQHQILSQIDMGVAIYTADRRLIYYNDAFVRLWGLKDEFLARQPSYSEVLEALRELRLLPEVRDVAAWLRQQNDVFQSLLEPKREWLHLRDQRAIETTVEAHPQGGLLFTYRDRSQPGAGSAATQTQQGAGSDPLMLAAFEHLPDAVAVFAADNTISYCNHSFTRLWQLPEKSGAARSDDFLSIIARQPLFAGAAAALNPAFLAHQEASGRLKFADKRLIDFALRPLNDGGMLLRCIDVTEAVRSEEALRSKERQTSEHLVHVSRALVDPLQAILGFSEMIPGAGSVTDKQHQYLEYIAEATRRLQEYVKDALDIASIEAGYRSLQRKPLRLDALLRGIADLLRGDAEAKGIALQVNIAADVGMGTADEQRFKQLFSNLLSNAVKFTSFGGSVTLKALRSGGTLEVTILDTGSGMNAEQLARARGELPLSGAHGLGLQLARQNIELHGGTIEFISTPNQGTLVTVRVPCLG